MFAPQRRTARSTMVFRLADRDRSCFFLYKVPACQIVSSMWASNCILSCSQHFIATEIKKLFCCCLCRAALCTVEDATPRRSPPTDCDACDSMLKEDVIFGPADADGSSRGYISMLWPSAGRETSTVSGNDSSGSLVSSVELTGLPWQSKIDTDRLGGIAEASAGPPEPTEVPPSTATTPKSSAKIAWTLESSTDRQFSL
mmetsp:Transcript_60431/g.112227  ORF Transcript_60431/g.112227 Transcript_60431/m.112227 type:complete len:200 (-) Transcript_60431:1537-2136(-)